MKNTKSYSYVKLPTATMAKIASISEKRTGQDQITRTKPAMVITLVNEAYEAEIVNA